MKILKLVLIVFFFAITILLISANPVDAAAYTPVCVDDYVHCGNGADDDADGVADNQKCEPLKDDNVHISEHWPHRAQLSLDNKNFTPNSQLFVTECLSGNGIDLNNDGTADTVCTSGDSNFDKQLFCSDPSAPSSNCDHFTFLKNNYGYGFAPHGESPTNTYGVFYRLKTDSGAYVRTVPPTPFTADANGKSTVARIEWQGYSTAAHDRSYVAWQFVQPASTTGAPTPTGEDPGQKQGTLTFSKIDTPPPTNCKAGESWDPYGRAFDSVSLEPITDMSVSLSQKRPDGVFDEAYALQNNILIVNPFKTGSDGRFYFLVVDGEYKLTPTLAGYIHPSEYYSSSLPSLAQDIYSDLYWSDSPAIEQAGAIQHRDIPVQPQDGVGKSYPLAVLTENFSASQDSKITYSGRVSHPFATLNVSICSDETGTKICNPYQTFDKNNKGPDKEGIFQVALDESKLGLGEYFERTFVKYNAAGTTQTYINKIQKFVSKISAILIPEVNAQDSIQKAKTTALIQPIPRYIEGFAYNSDGKLLPNAKVKIYIPTSQNPTFETQTNDQGFYRINSDHLPSSPYIIGYESGDGSMAKISTSQFLTQNKEYITQEKIEVYKQVSTARDVRRNITPTYVPPQAISPVIAQISPTQQPSPTSEKVVTETTTRNPVYLIVAVALILIGGTGALLAVYIYKKKKNQESEI